MVRIELRNRKGELISLYVNLVAVMYSYLLGNGSVPKVTKQ